MSTQTSLSKPHRTLEQAEQAYRERTPTSGALSAQASILLPGGVSRQTLAISPYPPFITGAHDSTLVDADGKQYIDFVNNYTSLIHGHAYQPVLDAIARSLEQLGSAPGLPTTLEHELARELCRRVASVDSVRFMVSGSEGVGYALRIARAYTMRPRILKFEGGFHGSFDEVQQNVGLEPLEAARAAAATANSSGVAPVETVVALYNDLDSVADAFARWPGEIAAVIAEPFLGNAGLLEARPGFLAGIADLARENGAVFILDEVQSCRLAYGAAQSLHDVRPDLTVLGKTIGGGLPIAAVGGRADLMALFGGDEAPVPQTGTFNAFPPSLAAGLAALADFGPDEVAALNRDGAQLRGRLADVLAAHNVPAQITGSGSMFHIALTTEPLGDYAAFRRCDFATWRILYLELLGRGIYLMPRGTGCLSTVHDQAASDAFILALDMALSATFDR